MEFQKQAKCDKWEPYQEILSRNPRMERIVRQISFPTNDAAAVTSVCVLAPALGSFTQWLLQGALTGGKERLYFLARDGYLMYQAAGIFCEVLDLPVTCRYLSCSRYSLRLPALHRNREEALDFLCRKASGITLEKLLRRAGLTQEESADVLRRLSLGLQPEEALAPARLPEIRRALACCPTFGRTWTSTPGKRCPDLPGICVRRGCWRSVPTPSWTAAGPAPCRRPWATSWEIWDVGSSWRGTTGDFMRRPPTLTGEITTAVTSGRRTV